MGAMRFTRNRWFKALVAAIFLWGNVAVAAHACIAAFAAQVQEPVAVQDVMPDAAQEHEACVHGQQAPADPALCFAHCLQGDQVTAQKISIDMPGAVCAPMLFVLHPLGRVAPAAPVLALVAPSVGPPLTILFGNFRI